MSPADSYTPAEAVAATTAPRWWALADAVSILVLLAAIGLGSDELIRQALLAHVVVELLWAGLAQRSFLRLLAAQSLASQVRRGEPEIVLVAKRIVHQRNAMLVVQAVMYALLVALAYATTGLTLQLVVLAKLAWMISVWVQARTARTRATAFLRDVDAVEVETLDALLHVATDAALAYQRDRVPAMS